MTFNFQHIRQVGLRHLFVIFAACLAVYWPGLGGGFFFDDGPSILLAPGVKMASLSWDDLKQAWYSGAAGPFGRPLPQLSFALNYYFSGFSPFAFKLSNLVIHCLCGVVVFCLASRISAASTLRGEQTSNPIMAVVLTAVWLLHPIQLLPVLHVVQRMTSLSALFLLAALYLHIVARERSGFKGTLIIAFAWLALWPMSVLSKETGLLFPLFVLLWELTIRRNATGQLDGFARALTAAVAVVSVLAVGYMVSDRGQWLWAGYDLRPFSLEQRLMTEGRVLWLYISLIVYPRLAAFGLYHDDIVPSVGWIEPWTTLTSSLGMIALLLIAWRMRRRAPLIAFGLAWFFAGHLMESTVLPLELAHEHRNYLPMLGLVFAGAGAWNEAFQIKPPPRIAIGALVGLIVYLSAVTAMRAHQFGDEVRRTQMAAYQHSGSARAQYEAGSILAELVDAAKPDTVLFKTAQQHLQASMDLNPDFKMGGLGLIYLNCKVAKQLEPATLDELAARLKTTPFAPGDQTVLYNVKEMAINGTLCLSREQVNGLFAAALANPTASAYIRSILLSWHADYLWLSAKDMAAARDALSQSLAINPASPSNRLKWAQLLFISGDRANAAALLSELRAEKLSSEERLTLEELLQAPGMRP